MVFNANVGDADYGKMIYQIYSPLYVANPYSTLLNLGESAKNKTVHIYAIANIGSGDLFEISPGKNLKEDDWKDIREKLLSYWKLTKDYVDGCCSCEYRYACHDCRPLAIGTTGGIYDKYPRCCYEPLNGIWKELQLS